MRVVVTPTDVMAEHPALFITSGAVVAIQSEVAQGGVLGLCPVQSRRGHRDVGEFDVVDRRPRHAFADPVAVISAYKQSRPPGQTLPKRH